MFIICVISGGNHTSSSIGAEVDSDATSSSPLQFVSERPNRSFGQSKEVSSPLDAGCLQFGTRGNEGTYCIVYIKLVNK